MVTGSSSGIGRAIAVKLAEQGFDIIVHAATREALAQETAQSVRQSGGASHVLLQDFLAAGNALEAFVDRAFQWQGRVDCWVNNAGGDVLTGPRRNESLEQKLDYLWQVDVRATLLISRLVAERMMAAVACPGWGDGPDAKGGLSIGSVINIGWDQANSGLPGDSGQLFSCTKGAIMAMTSSLAMTYAPRVRFNCVAPGWIRTQWAQEADPGWEPLVAQQSLMGRWGEVDDVAGAVAFLASPAARYINGQCLSVNGGLRTTGPLLAAKLLKHPGL